MRLKEEIKPPLTRDQEFESVREAPLFLEYGGRGGVSDSQLLAEIRNLLEKKKA
jgi:hypothetical protein